MSDLIRKSDALAAAKGFIGAETAIAALPAVTVGVQEAVIHRAVLDWVKDDTGAAIKMTITPDQANALTARILAALEPVSAPRRYMGQIMAECDCSRQGECEAAQKCLAVAALDDLARLGQEYDAAPDLTDPVTVHANMLRGTIAKPTVEQIIHLYGVDVLTKALAPVIVREAGIEPVAAPAEDAAAKGETDGETLERLGMDGSKWAAEFRTTALRLGYSDMDEGWLIGWFCNAIMAGYDRSPATDPAAIREAALREAAEMLMREGFEYAPKAVLALIPKGAAE